MFQVYLYLTCFILWLYINYYVNVPQAREYLENKLSEVATKYNSVSFYVTESQTRVPVLIAHYLNGYQEVSEAKNVNFAKLGEAP